MRVQVVLGQEARQGMEEAGRQRQRLQERVLVDAVKQLQVSLWVAGAVGGWAVGGWAGLGFFLACGVAAVVHDQALCKAAELR